jgi:dihydrofolate reductase
MRKIIFAINITIDGFADHTAVIADDELHDFYSELLDSIDIILFGRKTYQLMESFWPAADNDPRSTRSMIEYAQKINAKPKIVFSKTLEKVTWQNTRLVKENMIDEVIKLKNEPGKNLSAGSLSIASALAVKGLIDEYWFLVQPIILGKGKHLLAGLKERIDLVHAGSKTFKSGVVVLHYLSRK